MRDRAGAQRRPSGADASSPVYIISVAAELVSVHPRTLRIYEGASDVQKVIIARQTMGAYEGDR